MLTAMNHFFLSECLWSITNGGYHTPISLLVMMAICIFIFRQKIVPTVLLTVSAHLFSFFTLIGLVYLCNIEYIPDHDGIYMDYGVMSACIYLGIIYAVLQSIFFMILRRFFSFNLSSMLMIAWISNITTAWIMYRALSR